MSFVVACLTHPRVHSEGKLRATICGDELPSALLGLRTTGRYAGPVLLVLRIVGVFNAVIWLGSAIFFTFGIAPGIFGDEMKRVFGPYYTGVIGQNLIARYFAVNLICAAVAIVHFFAEIIYTGKPFRRFTIGLLIGILSLGFLGQYVFAPKIKAVHHAKYLGNSEDRPAAGKQLSRLHAVSSIGNLISLLALVIYTWQVTNPPDYTRFVSAQKFRG